MAAIFHQAQAVAPLLSLPSCDVCEPDAAGRRATRGGDAVSEPFIGIDPPDLPAGKSGGRDEVVGRGEISPTAMTSCVINVIAFGYDKYDDLKDNLLAAATTAVRLVVT